jgi:XTP/dITP diphosphohydrolase
LREIRSLLAELAAGVQLLSLVDFPEIPEIPETGTTFKENALLKARAVARGTGLLTLADDSGLEVDYLHGAPGVYSARFAGEPPDDTRNNAKLLALLNQVPAAKRTARFRCVIALVTPEERVAFAEGACDGTIGFEPQGTGGFGYDPIFYLPRFGCSIAELDLSVKNQISHRGKALRQSVVLLRELLGGSC